MTHPTPEVVAALEHIDALCQMPIENQKSFVRKWPEIGWDAIVVTKDYRRLAAENAA